MAKDVKDAGDMIGSVLGTVAREISESVSSNGHKGKVPLVSGNDGFSGARGLAAGALLATAAPIAGKAAKKLVTKGLGSSVASKGSDAAEKLGGGVKDVGKGVAGAVSKGDGKDKEGAPGVGKGRRMPVQQSADIGVPLSTVYNQWTQFEEWPQFMHRFDQVTQEDDCTVSFKVKVWGMSKEFVAEIEEQRPDERIQWNVKEGVTHAGVVTFHELAPRLTRVQVSLDLEPGSLIEKAARGMRHVKRAVRADLARFKAFIEMKDEETGAWRGAIHEGEVVKRRETKSNGSKAGKSSKSSSKSSRSGKASSKSGKSSNSRSKPRSRSRGSSSGSSPKRKRSSSRR